MLAPQHKYMNDRYYDRITQDKAVNDTRSAEEIIAEVMSQNGLTFKKREEPQNGTS